MIDQGLENNGIRGIKLFESRIIALREKQCRSVILLNEIGISQKEYVSSNQATIELSLTSGAVSRICNVGYKQTQGYFFKLEDQVQKPVVNVVG